MRYLIVAYALVLGTLLVHGLWLRRQRQALTAQERADERPEGSGEPRR